MTGIVGFTFSGDPAGAGAELSAMLSAVQDHPSYHVEHWVADGIALGRVSLGRIDRQPQPIWNEDRTHCIVFEGELFDTVQVRSELETAGHRFVLGNAAELVLHLWEEQGEEGLRRLNGGFTFAVWNAVDRSLAVGNDRFGFRHVYYALLGNQLAFACGVRGLLAHGQLPRAIDRVGIAQALHFEHLLGDRTYVAGVKLLPPAAVLYMQAEHCTRHRYWHWSMPEYYQPHSRAEYLEELLRLFEQAAARQVPCGAVRGGMNLSGGLDSRMLLGLLSTQMDVCSLQTYSFGIEGCDDVAIGRQVANAVKAPHYALPLPDDYLVTYAPVGVRLTDGMDSSIHIHSLANIDTQAQQVDLLYTGYYSDSITDSDGTRELLVRFDDDTSMRLHYDYMHRIFPEDSDAAIYTPEFLTATREEFDGAFRQAVGEVKCDTMSNWMDSVEIVHRQRRLTQFGNDLIRWQVESRTPFTDVDVVDFCLELPPGLRVDRLLFTETLINNFPKLAKIRNDRTGMPFLVDARYLSLQTRRNIHYWLNQRGLVGSVPKHRRKLYARYDLWFRTSLRRWVEGILLEPKALNRGIIRPEVMRKVIQEHMAGADRTREIGMLLSVELWHRAYID
jgi:asparagine synthase (glutamine-hydrolysing)